MKETLFAEYVNKWFKAIAQKLTETINGKKEAPKYLHTEMLTPEYSSDLKWGSDSIDGSVVSADIVAMESPLPLKKRDSISSATGDVPKVGMMLSKGERMLQDMQIMMARGTKEVDIVAKLFADAPRCVSGIKESVETMFLEALSTGMMLIKDENNVGTGIRANFNFLKKNKFGATIKWGLAGYVPLSDIARVIASTEDTITTICLSKKAFNLIRTSDEGKELSANFRGLVITDNGRLPVPTPSQFNEAVADEYGYVFKIIDRSVIVEKNGVRKAIKPFDEDMLVFLTTERVGRLVYGTLAEETFPVEGVKYEKVDGYILLSKYAENKPLREFTSAQALVIPVIDNVDSIYLLNTQEAQEVSSTEKENDESFTIYGQALVKADVITALKAIDVSCAINISDAKLIARINGLSEVQEEQLKAKLNITA